MVIMTEKETERINFFEGVLDRNTHLNKVVFCGYLSEV